MFLCIGGCVMNGCIKLEVMFYNVFLMWECIEFKFIVILFYVVIVGFVEW